MNANTSPCRLSGPWARTAFLAACAGLCLLAQCRFGPEPEGRTDQYVTVRLNDSLGRFDSVNVQILAEGDTSAIVGTLWSGRLADPGSIPSYLLDQGETRTLSIRVRAWDADGRLALDERIGKADGKQVVTLIPIPMPSPRLASLSVSQGSLSPAFAAGTHAYTLSLPPSQSSLRVTAAPEYAYARIFVDALQAKPGEPSQPIPLAIGSNRITLTVVAADTSDQYILTVLRAAPTDTSHSVPIDTGKQAPEDTLFKDWKHKGVVVLTLPSAEGLQAEPSVRVTGFPLLLRLNAANFDFSETADSGRDLRFTTPQGKLLDHDIARWDADARQAEVFIRCDTLSAGGQSPTLLMYWGNANAASAAAPEKVFSKDAGWTGAWHFEERGAGKAGEYRDATGMFPGTAAGAFPTRMDGPVGYSQDFNSGSQGWITLPNEYDPGTDRFTLNMWIYGEGKNTAYVLIKSGMAASDQRFELDIGQGAGNYSFGSNGIRTTFGFGAPQLTWQLLGIVCGPDSVHFFANGVLKESHRFALKGDPHSDVIIGARNPEGTSGFQGRLDEIWSFSGSRDAWYMRLLYENQKPGSTLAALSRL